MASQRIMLIDNEAGLCRMMEAVLKDQGYQVKSFTRPVQAVAEFSAALVAEAIPVQGRATAVGALAGAEEHAIGLFSAAA